MSSQIWWWWRLPHLYFYAVLLSAHWPKIDLGKGHISFVALILYQALNVSFESFLNAEWLPQKGCCHFITENKTKPKFKTKTVATGFYSEKNTHNSIKSDFFVTFKEGFSRNILNRAINDLDLDFVMKIVLLQFLPNHI